MDKEAMKQWIDAIVPAVVQNRVLHHLVDNRESFGELVQLIFERGTSDTVEKLSSVVDDSAMVAVWVRWMLPKEW